METFASKLTHFIPRRVEMCGLKHGFAALDGAKPLSGKGRATDGRDSFLDIRGIARH